MKEGKMKLSLNNEINNNQTFKNRALISKIGYNAASLFIKSQENLSSTRFIQDTATNWLPKAIFSRSKEDLAEQSFLEFTESAIFYFASPILGEKLFRNGIFKNLQPKNLKNIINEQISKSLKEIANNKNLTKELKNRAITTKAGIVLSCIAIPVAEYTLSFAKNLFTLKAFNKSNFNNIANLDITHTQEHENKEQQKKVEKNAKKKIKQGVFLSLLGVGAGVLLSKYGYKNEKLINLSKNILEPGLAISKKLNIENEKIKNSIEKINFDFSNNKGKLALSKGQLGLTAILGLFGYSKAAQDRGKLDVAEVWTRVPLVVLYTIFGGELFEKGFINILDKKGKYKDILKKDTNGKINIPTLDELPALAKKIAANNRTNVDSEYKKLLKQKTLITGIPYAFSLLFMGFTLSAITRLWTQIRYNHQNNNKNNNENKVTTINPTKNLPINFKAFEK